MNLFVFDTANEALLNSTNNLLWVALLCLIAIGSVLALRVVTSSARMPSRPTRQALLMLGVMAFGLAITFMHFSGMAAIPFLGQSDTQEPTLSEDVVYLALTVAMAVAFILGLVAIWVLQTRLKVSLTAQKVQSYELEAVSDQAAQGVVTILDGKIKRINRAFENIFECTTEDVARQHVSAYIPEWPQLVEQTARHMAIETIGKRQDGVEFPIEIQLTHLKSGPLAYDIGFINDLSDQDLQSKLRHGQHHDFLTGLHNRQFMQEQLAIEFSRIDRTGTPLSLLLLDIDHFKEINEVFGHIAGDKVLAQIASMLRMNSRNGDILSRYGGEEFLLLLPNTDLNSAMQAAERIRSETEKLALSRAGKTIRFTVSLGVTCLQSTFALTPKDLIRSADMALYRAKQAGRNRVEFEVSGSNAGNGTVAHCNAPKEALFQA